MNSDTPIRAGSTPLRKVNQGFSLVELLIAVLIILVMAAFAVPMTTHAVDSFKMDAAGVAVANAISATRYQAIMNGYKFKIAFDAAKNSYQVSSMVPPAVAFSNVGSVIPITSSPEMVISAATTLQFSPGGTVSATAGAMTFNLTYKNMGKQITISNLGSVSVTNYTLTSY
jgi:prepilin-type N-terminal cleavage/methylation domain-containing protein